MADPDHDDTDEQPPESFEARLDRIRRAAPQWDAPGHRAMLASSPSFFIPPPFGFRHPITGIHGYQPSYELVTFGMYVKRGRYLARVTQQGLEDLSGVDQGQISRLERGLAPWTRAQELVRIGKGLGRAFPLGFCPHQHWCEWQPAPPPPPERDWLAEAQAQDTRIGRVVEDGEVRWIDDDD